ncbi:MAG: chemotaxis protein CheD [Thermobacillus sp.]|uniref:Probable chemoreceptor glutamine deamidase CheD n=1 Tax=Thermobacillus composti (strain DSM 18247 / JCM 13945 / KWC4) TaxID=717605 RepID=L0EGB5_THECK|nr:MULTISPECIES: chemotaxis protein CheD [Thermobacillus]AGA58200.1 chemotaxis protein [Thermobacillus composti KWC4]REK57923.1 MAG: chemotaxis protein CheD [Thermobacillus sp.]
MTELIKVGMADWKIASSGDVLKTTGLGSCVGLTLYDGAAKIAGMAHIMLPSSEIAREEQFNRAKYADTALPDMLQAMIAAGASRRRLVAKLAGGAQMFAFAGQDTMRIGPRNVETCKMMLESLDIPLVAEDTGANYGRTIELDSTTGVLTIRSIQYGTKEL